MSGPFSLLAIPRNDANGWIEQSVEQRRRRDLEPLACQRAQLVAGEHGDLGFRAALVGQLGRVPDIRGGEDMRRVGDVLQPLLSQID